VKATPKLDLNLLAVLVALFDAGSVSRAATKLGLSQPTVSGMLAKLRAHFDEPLFVRSAGGMAPTPRCADMVAAAREILRQVDEKLQPEGRFDPGRRHAPFTFAMSDVGQIVFLPRLVQALAQASPDTPVRTVTMRPPELMAAFEAGQVDLAIGYFPDLKHADFFQQRLFNHHFVCLLRAGHPIQGRRLSLGDFLTLSHAVVQSEGRSQEIFEAYLQAHGLTRKVGLYTPHFLSIPRLIAQSDMVVTVPHAIGIEYGTEAHGLKVLQPPFASPRIELRQHWHRKTHKDARNVWLRRLVSRLFNDDNDEWRGGDKP
jgi:DNA-binding transcriptional LysR family regulator